LKAQNTMIGLIIIGDEILSGRREDKHLVKAIQLLGERGMAVSWVRYVGDEPDRITADLKHALESGDLVFSFGGIGATPDDHTRACAAHAMGVEMALHPDARDLILDRCREMAQQEGVPFEADSADTLRRLNMGVFPVGADIIPNPYNRIPGFSLQGRVHFLPGFPVMAWPMMAWVLDQLHADLHNCSKSQEHAVVVYEAIESRLTPLMLDIEAQFASVKVFSLPSVDHPVHGRHIELGVKGNGEDAAKAFEALLHGLHQIGVAVGPKTVRPRGT
jgi:molybdopterin-biosynthesis enzyme MoeA-like protein